MNYNTHNNKGVVSVLYKNEIIINKRINYISLEMGINLENRIGTFQNLLEEVRFFAMIYDQKSPLVLSSIDYYNLYRIFYVLYDVNNFTVKNINCRIKFANDMVQKIKKKEIELTDCFNQFC